MQGRRSRADTPAANRGPASRDIKINAPTTMGRPDRSSRRCLPTVFTSDIYVGEPDSVTITVPVDHRDVCGRWHLHRLRSVAPVTRRALCGFGRYRVVPVVADVKYGRDWPDTDLWADHDGQVYRGDGHVPAPRPATDHLAAEGAT